MLFAIGEKVLGSGKNDTVNSMVSDLIYANRDQSAWERHARQLLPNNLCLSSNRENHVIRKDLERDLISARGDVSMSGAARIKRQGKAIWTSGYDPTTERGRWQPLRRHGRKD